jgi:hypothetical protein
VTRREVGVRAAISYSLIPVMKSKWSMNSRTS